jgi:hypothetical protein
MKASLVILLLCAQNVNLLELIGKFDDEISSYVRDLITDYNIKELATNNVALLKFNLNPIFKQHVDDVFEDVRKAIPAKNPIFCPAIDEPPVVNRLQNPAFIIIVTDAGNHVSEVVHYETLNFKSTSTDIFAS